VAARNFTVAGGGVACGGWTRVLRSVCPSSAVVVMQRLPNDSAAISLSEKSNICVVMEPVVQGDICFLLENKMQNYFIFNLL
jgi:hypothetical protein